MSVLQRLENLSFRNIKPHSATDNGATVARPTPEGDIYFILCSRLAQKPPQKIKSVKTQKDVDTRLCLCYNTDKVKRKGYEL